MATCRGPQNKLICGFGLIIYEPFLGGRKGVKCWMRNLTNGWKSENGSPRSKKRNRKALLVNVNETDINFMLLASEIN